MSRAVIPWGNGEIAIQKGTALSAEFKRNTSIGKLFWTDYSAGTVTLVQDLISNNSIYSFWDQQKHEMLMRFCEKEGIALPKMSLQVNDNMATNSFRIDQYDTSSLQKLVRFFDHLSRESKTSYDYAIEQYNNPLARPDFVIGIRMQNSEEPNQRSIRGRIIDKLTQELYRAHIRGVSEQGIKFNCSATFPDISEYPTFPNHFPNLMLAIIYLMPVRYDENMGEVACKKEYGFKNGADVITESRKMKEAVKPHLQEWAKAQDVTKGFDLVIVDETLAEVVEQLTHHPLLASHTRHKVANLSGIEKLQLK